MNISKEEARFAMLLAAIATGHVHKPKLKEIVQTGFAVLEELEAEELAAKQAANAPPAEPPPAPVGAGSPATAPSTTASAPPAAPAEPPAPPTQSPPAKKGKE